MRISEITSQNKPYIRIVRGKKKVEIPIIPKMVVVPPNKALFRNCGYVGCESIRINFKGKIVKLNWTFNHNKMTLFCSSGHKAYSWNNVKVATITNSKGKKEHLVVCKKAYGDETERRRFKRFPIAKNVTLIQGNNKYPATTVDISYGGVGVAVKKRITLIPSEPILIDFGANQPIKARLVRTVFREDGSEMFGCYISKVFRYEMTRIIRAEMPEEETKEKKEEKDTDAGWKQTSIKRWH